jgi:Holliday junction resolvase RusA-like endonuclease
MSTIGAARKATRDKKHAAIVAAFAAWEAKNGRWARMELTINGPPAIKKNQKQIFRGRGGRPFITPSEKYKQWAAYAEMMIKIGGTKGLPTIPREVCLRCEIKSYLPDKRRVDLDNLYAGPQDVLQSAGVIEDDYSIVSHDGSRRFVDPENPRVEIVLERMF